MSYPSSICADCGEKHGRRAPGIATWTVTTCDMCGCNVPCTEPVILRPRLNPPTAAVNATPLHPETPSHPPAELRGGQRLGAMPCWASLNPTQRLALREYLKAVKKSEKMARKAADDFGMGRRRSTTNAANWSTYAGQRDRLEKTLIETGVPLTRIIEIEAEWRKVTKN